MSAEKPRRVASLPSYVIVKGEIAPLRSEQKVSNFLPKSILAAIGRVAVEWAGLENALNDLIWTIEGVEMDAGRIKTEKKQISDLLVACQNAMQGHLIGDKFKPIRIKLTDLKITIENAKKDRNLAIHGLWCDIDYVPSVGSLRLETPDTSSVTFEAFDKDRLTALANLAKAAKGEASKIMAAIKTMRNV